MKKAAPWRVGLAAALLCVGFGGSALARDLYVSPQGTPDGDGSRARPLDLRTALSARSPARGGDTLYLLPGTYRTPALATGQPTALACEVSGEKGRPVRIRSAPDAHSVHINAPLHLSGSFVEYIGLEIGDAAWTPTRRPRRPRPIVTVGRSRGVKLINCNLFGGAGGGVSAGVEAVDFEMYGCLIHDFGQLLVETVPMAMEDIQVVRAGTGEGFTSANREGTKVLMHNLIYRGCGGNIQLSTFTVGYDFIENVSFLSKAYKTNENMDSFPICSNYQRGEAVPMDRIRMIGNVAYQPVDISGWRSNMRLISYRPGVINGEAVVKDNTLMGAANGLALTQWRRLELTGNTLWATRTLISLDPADPAALKGWRVDRNTYIDNGRGELFPSIGGGERTFEAWRRLGFDRNGRLLPGRGGRPTGTSVFVFPNRYEKGRAHVAVFNWDGRAKVPVDLSKVLANGRRFVLYNCLDIRHTLAAAKPVLTGVYDGRPIPFPMRGDPISPDFDAFLVLPQ